MKKNIGVAKEIKIDNDDARETKIDIDDAREIEAYSLVECSFRGSFA